MTETNKKALILLVVLIGAVVIGRLIIKDGSISHASIGSRGVLADTGGRLVAVGMDENALLKFHQALRIKDRQGSTALLLSGRVFSVATGTNIMVIDYGSVGIRKIRVLDGDRKGLSGFVHEESIQ